VVPPGYYLKGPGQVAPCPKGEFKSGYGAVASCSKCATGVSTKDEASIDVANCTEVLPTYFPAAMTGSTVTATQKCIQKLLLKVTTALVAPPAQSSPQAAPTLRQRTPWCSACTACGQRAMVLLLLTSAVSIRGQAACCSWMVAVVEWMHHVLPPVTFPMPCPHLLPTTAAVVPVYPQKFHHNSLNFLVLVCSDPSWVQD
jgi:hypothetical protein